MNEFFKRIPLPIAILSIVLVAALILLAIILANSVFNNRDGTDIAQNGVTNSGSDVDSILNERAGELPELADLELADETNVSESDSEIITDTNDIRYTDRVPEHTTRTTEQAGPTLPPEDERAVLETLLSRPGPIILDADDSMSTERGTTTDAAPIRRTVMRANEAERTDSAESASRPVTRTTTTDTSERTTTPTMTRASQTPRHTMTPTSTGEARIDYFIIDYNERYDVSIRNPLLITLTASAPQNALYASVRVYARKANIRTRAVDQGELVFTMPKIYIVEGRTQTQFYFAGKTFEGDFLPAGHYLLFAELRMTDKDGNSVGHAARYPLPQWEHFLEIH